MDEKIAEVLHPALRRLKIATADLERWRAMYEAMPSDGLAIEYAQAWAEMVAAREHLCSVTPKREEMALAS